MTKEFECCQICPRNCKINRNMGHLGFCGTGKSLKVARAALHFWEEPPISGDKGSGTIFFSGCNLKCVYCQNYEISTGGKGKEISIDRFVELCLDLQKQGANNINLVTPTHYIPLIKEGILLAKEKGLKVYDQFGTIGDLSKENPRFGLHEFKKKFGGDYIEFLGEFDYVTNKLMYFVFTKLVPFYRKMVRNKSKKEIENEVKKNK